MRRLFLPQSKGSWQLGQNSPAFWPLKAAAAEVVTVFSWCWGWWPSAEAARIKLRGSEEKEKGILYFQRTFKLSTEILVFFRWLMYAEFYDRSVFVVLGAFMKTNQLSCSRRLDWKWDKMCPKKPKWTFVPSVLSNDGHNGLKICHPKNWTLRPQITCGLHFIGPAWNSSRVVFYLFPFFRLPFSRKLGHKESHWKPSLGILIAQKTWNQISFCESFYNLSKSESKLCQQERNYQHIKLQSRKR